ncbi:MAG: pyrimidine 5'-nucleotidase [Candidatus Pelagibacter sp.]|jgi:putative hydrolase of the HAD superfamily|nr:pyrimidine 5'-nucleotidase [Candidatus Pelagibacter sp.]MDB2341797.1 pyrimidine 5'-nucleotidase [Candidatus Pelagibacter bacterium]MDB2500285.1 pyrimidine 5'-nucleotidase [Candidatus Pelagibacter bacterium]
MKDLLNINYWIFDLDNTLYSGQTEVFSEVDKKMSAFISKKMNVDLIKAKEIQKKYFYEYGTTLSGLMKQDSIDPHEFLEFVHDIDISWLPKDLKLKDELIKIKEKKFIFTNGSHAHVENVTKQLGIDGLFDGAFDIVDANFVPKPHIDPYKKIIDKFKIEPTKSILIEDIAHNLEQAKNLGMKTCWLENEEAFAKKDADKPYIDYKIKNLPSFLQKINILKAA